MHTDNTPRPVYVNCSLDLGHVAAVGLDLDHTLAVYNDQAVNQLAFAETCLFLAVERGYPHTVMDISYDNSRISRGIVVDGATGNLLKLDFRDRVARATNAGRGLRTEEIIAQYRDMPVDPSTRRFHQIASPFDLPAGLLFEALITHRPPSGSGSDYSAVLEDVVRMLDASHTRGALKRQILGSPERFVERRPGVDRMLSRLRANGVKTFLLTNSGLDYTVRLLDHVFSTRTEGARGWTDLFDAVVANASKPSFFTAERGRSDGPAAAESVAPRLLDGGSAAELEILLGSEPETVLYVGDNPAADGVPARRRGWKVAMVVPELATDQPLSSPTNPASDGAWGSVFWEGGSPTRFNRVLRETAHFFAARVEDVLDHTLKGGLGGP